MNHPSFDWFAGRIVISCQAPVDSPLRKPDIMAALAEAAQVAGAAGIRAEGAVDIAAIRARVDLPLIGIRKHNYPGFDVFITATTADVDIVADAGAPLVAMDATPRPRPGGQTLQEVVAHAHARGLLVMADLLDPLDAGYAVDAGVDALGTTLVAASAKDIRQHGPNLDAVTALRREYPDTPVVAEGRYATPADVRGAFDAGATSVVIGTAVTDAYTLTRHLVQESFARSEAAR